VSPASAVSSIDADGAIRTHTGVLGRQVGRRVRACLSSRAGLLPWTATTLYRTSGRERRYATFDTDKRTSNTTRL